MVVTVRLRFSGPETLVRDPLRRGRATPAYDGEASLGRVLRDLEPGDGFERADAAEVMAMIRKGQVESAPANDMKARSDFIAALFSVAA